LDAEDADEPVPQPSTPVAMPPLALNDNDPSPRRNITRLQERT
jgi:hypothetical protein